MSEKVFVDYARDDTSAGVSGALAEIKHGSPATTIDSLTTSADGKIAFTRAEIGYPGATWLEVSKDGTTRKHTGESIGQVGAVWMADFIRLFRVMTDGVVAGVDGELEVTADNTGMHVDVAAGLGIGYGLPYYWDTSREVEITANASGNPRIDLIVLRYYPSTTTDPTDIGRIDLAAIEGTPAGSPVAPSLTNDPETYWEVALAEVLVNSGVSAIAADKVTDRRTFSSGPLMDASVTTAKLADNAVTPAKMSNGTDYSTSAIAKVLKANTSPNATPSFGSLSTKELSDFAQDNPANGQVPVFNSGTGLWGPGNASLTIVVQEGDATVEAAATTLDFNATNFDVTSSPSGEANIAIADGAISNANVNALAAISATKIGLGTVDNTEYGYLNGVTGPIQTQLNDKAAAVHTHSLSAVTDVTASAAEVNVLDGITASTTELNYTDGVTSAIQTQLNGKSATSHTHVLTDPPAGFATKSYGATNVTSTATDGVEIAGFDMDIPSGGAKVIAQGWGQMNAPASPGSYILLGVKIGSQATDWGMENQTESGERPATATSIRSYGSGASAQRISLRAKVDGGTGTVNAAHINAFGIARSVPAS